MQQQRNQFTLIELMIVIAIIAILITMLLPALKRAKDSAKRLLCIANHKKSIVAVFNYADDFDNYSSPQGTTEYVSYSDLPPYKEGKVNGCRKTHFLTAYYGGGLKGREIYGNMQGFWGCPELSFPSINAYQSKPTNTAFNWLSGEGWFQIYLSMYVGGRNIRTITKPSQTLLMGDGLYYYVFSINSSNPLVFRHHAKYSIPQYRFIRGEDPGGMANVGFTDGHVDTIVSQAEALSMKSNGELKFNLDDS